MPKDEGGPAFPSVVHSARWEGMSRRDWFAGMALQGILAARTDQHYWAAPSEVATRCYDLADAVLVAGQKERP